MPSPPPGAASAGQGERRPGSTVVCDVACRSRSAGLRDAEPPGIGCGDPVLERVISSDHYPGGEDRRAREPVFNAPGLVVAILAVLAAVHGLRSSIVSEDTDREILVALSLIPARTLEIARELPGGEGAFFWQYVSHVLLHGDITHLMVNGAWFLVFGTLIARRLPAASFLLLFLVCAVIGGLAFTLANPASITPVVGASGAVSGLMGATMRLMFPAIDMGSMRILTEAPGLVGPATLARSLTDRRVLAATGALVALNLLLATGFSAMFNEGGIAWEAHLGGYFAGLLGYGWFERPRDLPPSSGDLLA